MYPELVLNDDSTTVYYFFRRRRSFSAREARSKKTNTRAVCGVFFQKNCLAGWVDFGFLPVCARKITPSLCHHLAKATPELIYCSQFDSVCVFCLVTASERRFCHRPPHDPNNIGSCGKPNKRLLFRWWWRTYLAHRKKLTKNSLRVDACVV